MATRWPRMRDGSRCGGSEKEREAAEAEEEEDASRPAAAAAAGVGVTTAAVGVTGCATIGHDEVPPAAAAAAATAAALAAVAAVEAVAAAAWQRARDCSTDDDRVVRAMEAAGGGCGSLALAPAPTLGQLGQLGQLGPASREALGHGPRRCSDSEPARWIPPPLFTGSRPLLPP